jgi:hypothetical protein
VIADHTILAEHQGRNADLGDARGEVVVPEQLQLLAERVAAVQHGIQPPAA